MTPQPPAADAPRTMLRESLAALEHEQWEKWSREVAEQGLTPERIERWSRYWVPYANLDEQTKDHDRKWADRVLQLTGEAAAQPALDVIERIRAALRGRSLIAGDHRGHGVSYEKASIDAILAAEYARLAEGREHE